MLSPFTVGRYTVYKEKYNPGKALLTFFSFLFLGREMDSPGISHSQEHVLLESQEKKSLRIGFFRGVAEGFGPNEPLESTFFPKRQ